MSTETEAKPVAPVADDTEAIAAATWETAYPDRRPWAQLEEQARAEWCRVVRVMREAQALSNLDPCWKMHHQAG